MSEITNEKCEATGCVRLAAKGRRLCYSHKAILSRDGSVQGYTPGFRRAVGHICEVAGCSKETSTARKFCNPHRLWFKRHGTFDGFENRQKRTPRDNINPQGYRYLTVEGKRILEHRYVMEGVLGRKLLAGESVHHLNGQRADNRIENLELWSTSQPYGQRVTDKVAWAKEIIALYDH